MWGFIFCHIPLEKALKDKCKNAIVSISRNMKNGISWRNSR
jgi:hypothetical protein